MQLNNLKNFEKWKKLQFKILRTNHLRLDGYPFLLFNKKLKKKSKT